MEEPFSVCWVSPNFVFSVIELSTVDQTMPAATLTNVFLLVFCGGNFAVSLPYYPVCTHAQQG